ncbi:uncharacterized protein LOC110528434 [Oncorhynchus mykiss]|uniref:uncharacterized protein LOC110528434 n=1 Tax=Oncorhynchus mykiss TaxID=8022 RepID=UPI001878BDC7|nr:uncharacterized protein LOC110528434 [Oncorhynchus mykiss]
MMEGVAARVVLLGLLLACVPTALTSKCAVKREGEERGPGSLSEVWLCDSSHLHGGHQAPGRNLTGGPQAQEGGEPHHEPPPWSPHVSLILLDKAMDIIIGLTPIIIMLYKGNGIKFMWPVLRQRPTGDNIMGIMAHPPVAYEEVQGTTMKLKMKDKEVDVSRLEWLVERTAMSSSKSSSWVNRAHWMPLGLWDVVWVMIQW